MPTLQFKGKNIIWNHHLSIPYHIIEEDPNLSFQPDKGNGNLIVEGDNLIALKSLLPLYSGKVKCIYIDPPYNTGNEGWIYNDKVNSPLLKEWFNKAVGGGEDLTRHDKWLCMMAPRLKLLRELLSDDGVIFISIDDNEAVNLMMLMDEIFGSENFIAQSVVQLNPRGRTLDRFLAKTHEYIIIYGKDAATDSTMNLLEKAGKALNDYNKEDEKGKYRELELRNRNPVFHRGNRPNLYFPIYVNPENEEVSLEQDEQHSVEVYPVNSRGVDGCWTWGTDKVKNNIEILIGRQVSTGAWRIFRKDYLVQNGQKALTKAKALWVEKEINNENGKERLNELFNHELPFDFPKSISLVKKCAILGSNDDDIILDSFAGSGTTMDAIMDLNHNDGGNRKCILVQMTENSEEDPDKNICKEVTRERVAKAIEKYGYSSGFKYLRVGMPIDPDSMLNGTLPTYEQFAQYVYYLCFGENIADSTKIDQSQHFVGIKGQQAVFLIYDKDFDNLARKALNLRIAEQIVSFLPNTRRIVYAPSCFLDEEYMEAMQIEFVSIPYNLFQRKDQ